MYNSHSSLPFVFFGTPRFAEIVLDELEQHGYRPLLIVTAPDKPKGRKLLMSPSEVKSWGIARNIPVITPPTLRDPELRTLLSETKAPLFIVAAYGKIIPEALLAIPEFGTLNVHPSLLPKFRGPSPIESTILSNETETGVTIIALDTETDHGPIVAQRVHHATEWPQRARILTDALAHEGGALLAEILPGWMNDRQSVPQDHTQATFTSKISKEHGLIDLSDDPLQNLRKIRAYDEWPGAFFFVERNGRPVRIKIVDAVIEDGKLKLTRVIPEGKREMSYDDFLRGNQ